MTITAQLILGGAAFASWLVLCVVTNKVPQAKHQGWELARTAVGLTAGFLLIPAVGSTKLGGDVYGACSIALMGGILIIGVIAAIGNIGNPFGGGSPPDGGAGA